MGTGQAFYADVKGRFARFGRSRGELLILPAATFVLGDTDAEAAEDRPRCAAGPGLAADRADYTGTTLRDHLGLDPLGRPGEGTTPARAVAATG